MYKIIIKDEVSEKIDNFIDNYLNSFLDLFIDSWINNLDLIIASYEKTAELFREKIYLELKNRLKEEIIWKKILKNAFQTTVLVWNYRLFVDFEEDIEEKIRFIENIEFHKR